MALAALNSGKRGANTIIMDNGVFMFGGHKFRSPENEQGGAMDMRKAIVKSSNVYFYSLANELGVDLIHEQMGPLGFGRLTGIDLKGEVTGILPSTEWKRNAYKRPELKRWYAGETISLGIGQGYNNFTMLQMASAMSTLVKDGQRYLPRVVREIEDVVTRQRHNSTNQALAPIPYKPEHTAFIREAMYGVTQEGTWGRATRAAARRARPRPWACARTRSTWPPRSTSTSATIRCTRPSRRWKGPPWPWPWWLRTPASVPRPQRPLRDACWITC